MRKLSCFAQLLVFFGVKEKPRHRYPKQWKRRFKDAYAYCKASYKKVYGKKPKEEYIRMEMRKCTQRTSTGMWYWPTTYSVGGVTSGNYFRGRAKIAVGPNGEIEPHYLDGKLKHEIMHHFLIINGKGSDHIAPFEDYIPLWR